MSMEQWKCGNKEKELKDGGVRIKMGWRVGHTIRDKGLKG